ncbi:hypothetical protein MAR_004952 [Mya arenaria]|uniref:Uncharacterized protein n=1 Tax=Mya arenaria TaxID=6604 RepID=A0ABY7F184_MYAAR|nr:hypothetical protein MAR_004952 [Mya arenaria]
MYEKLSFLPEPTPDASGAHYLPFKEAPKARDVVRCAECHKPRVVHSPSKTDREQDALLRRMKEENLYVCGDPMADDSGLVTLRASNCTSDVEIAYYSSGFSKVVPPVCCYCGTEDELLDDNYVYIQDMYTKFSKVRPLCKLCHGNGRVAKTWGKKFIKKRRIWND